MKLSIFLLAFFLGGTLYVLLELLWRGRSHVSMFCAGGLALLLLHGLFLRFALPLFAQCLVGGLVITAIEFVAGAIVNVHLKLNVWDYSKMPLNLYGQVCLPFSLLWCLLTLPISFLSGYLATL
ncbi:MAG: hypothetical protein KIC63_04885 [Clostridium sp.]|jgi:uncharacterized membrane protein|nr:hypothetical protein [Clostridium sp.]MCI5915311.1 putative ABC transporter permease [Christensenella sp.]